MSTCTYWGAGFIKVLKCFQVYTASFPIKVYRALESNFLPSQHLSCFLATLCSSQASHRLVRAEAPTGCHLPDPRNFPPLLLQHQQWGSLHLSCLCLEPSMLESLMPRLQRTWEVIQVSVICECNSRGLKSGFCKVGSRCQPYPFGMPPSFFGVLPSFGWFTCKMNTLPISENAMRVK